MQAGQRTFLIEARTWAYRKSRSTDSEVIINCEIKLSVINGMSEPIKNRIAEELTSQEIIEVTDRHRGQIKKFRFTKKGLDQLEESLRTAGVYQPISLEINQQLIEAISSISNKIQESNIQNKQTWMEIADTLKEEMTKPEPRKNVIATLLGTIIKGAGLGADVTTILSGAGLSPGELIGYVNNLLKL